VPRVEREVVEPTAKHEAAHAVAAYLLGWEVSEVRVRVEPED
jgi:hypothetical protein